MNSECINVSKPIKQKVKNNYKGQEKAELQKFRVMV